MSDQVLIDELHVSVSVPKSLDPRSADQVTRVLRSRRFGTELRQAIKSVFDRYQALRSTRVKISR